MRNYHETRERLERLADLRRERKEPVRRTTSAYTVADRLAAAYSGEPVYTFPCLGARVIERGRRGHYARTLRRSVAGARWNLRQRQRERRDGMSTTKKEDILL